MRDETGPETRAMAAREMTVAEYLDRAIDEAQRKIDGLRQLKRSLPSGYLDQGCSTLAQALRL